MLDRVSPKVANHGHGGENPSPIEQVGRRSLGLSLGHGWGAVASSHESAVELHFILGIICRDHTCISAQVNIRSQQTLLIQPEHIYRSTGHWLAARLLLLFCDCCDQRLPMVSG